MKRKRIIALCLAAVSLWLLDQVAIGQYHDLKSHAEAAESNVQTAETQLRVAMNDKDLAALPQACASLSSAREEFAYLGERINSFGWLYSLAEMLPDIGNQAEAARKLVWAGGYTSEAGEEVCLGTEALIGTEQGAGNSKDATELLLAAAPNAAGRFAQAKQALDLAQAEYQGISPDGLSPPFLQAMDTLETQVPTQRLLVQTGLNVLQILPEALGKDGEKVYLILVQDSGELRPTGGFIGNYGIIRFKDGKKVQTTFSDTYKLDWPYYYAGKAGPPIGMFARYFPNSTFWALRDANIWPDFERSAKQAASFAVKEGAAEKVDGVIGITGDIVVPLMRAVGPIYVPEYGEQVDASNVLERIRHYQTSSLTDAQLKRLGPEAIGNRKLFTSLVLSEVIDRLTKLNASQMLTLMSSLQNSFKSKAIQLYFADPKMQQLADAYDLDGSMKQSSGDYLWAVDMNLGAGKDNLYVKESITYTVSISATGGAISDVDITYDYRKTGDLFTGTIPDPHYSDYLRIYVPPGSVLLDQEGPEEPADTFSELGKTVFGCFVNVQPGTIKQIKLRYWQPLKLWWADGKAQYQLVVQKQAGNSLKAFEARVVLPPELGVNDRGNFQTDARGPRFLGSLDGDQTLQAGLKLR